MRGAFSLKDLLLLALREADIWLLNVYKGQNPVKLSVMIYSDQVHCSIYIGGEVALGGTLFFY